MIIELPKQNMDHRVILDVVVFQGAFILQLLTCFQKKHNNIM